MDNVTFVSFSDSDMEHFFILLLYAINIDNSVSNSETTAIINFSKLLKISKDEALNLIDNMKTHILSKGDAESIFFTSAQYFGNHKNRTIVNTVFECLVVLCYADGVFLKSEQDFIKTIRGTFKLSDKAYNDIMKSVEERSSRKHKNEDDNTLNNSSFTLPDGHASQIFDGLLKVFQR